jgi:hypothetical protein
MANLLTDGVVRTPSRDDGTRTYIDATLQASASSTIEQRVDSLAVDFCRNHHQYHLKAVERIHTELQV